MNEKGQIDYTLNDKLDYKQIIYQLLESKDFESLLELFAEQPNVVRKYVTMASFYQDNILGESALLFFRLLAEKEGALQPEYFREIIRRHIWGMNEEGANIDWTAPEIIGAIIASHPELFGEFATIMITAAIDEPIFQKGMFKAIQMIGPQNKDLIEYHLPQLKQFVYDQDPALAQLARSVLSEFD